MAQSKVLRAPKPRNRIVRLLTQRLLGVGAGRHQSGRHPSRQQENRDLAQRVRESGEW